MSEKLVTVEGPDSGKEYEGEARDEPEVGEEFQFTPDNREEDGLVTTKKVTNVTEKETEDGTRRVIIRTEDSVYAWEPDEEPRTE